MTASVPRTIAFAIGGRGVLGRLLGVARGSGERAVARRWGELDGRAVWAAQAVAVFRPPRFPGPPSEPDVRLSLLTA